MIVAAFASVSAFAGLITSAEAQAFQPNGNAHDCDTGTLNAGSAACSSAIGNNENASASAVADFGSVSAYVQGGAYRYGGGASATAIATFTDTLTFYGGTGTGTLSIAESILSYGTGSLAFGNYSNRPTASTVTQQFTFGVPFTLTLSAISSSSFSNGDGGSLLVQKIIQSISAWAKSGGAITYIDASGHQYNTAGTAAFTPAPEPATWVLGLIGLGLLAVARIRTVRPPTDGNGDGESR